MANRLQHLRGSESEHSTFTGAKGEISLVTDTSANRIPTGEVRVHDGTTSGGLPLTLGTTSKPLTNNIVLSSGVGINFNNYGSEDSNIATTVGSNLLDDYEEGTFLPIYKGTITDPTVGNFTLREGFYVKIGKLIHINLRIRGEISSVGSGNAILGGLPFTVVSTTGSTCSLSIGYFENWTTNGPTLALAAENTDEIHLFRYNAASGTRITVSNYKTGSTSYNEVFIAGTYLTN